jgi:hypothetical protein
VRIHVLALQGCEHRVAALERNFAFGGRSTMSTATLPKFPVSMSLRSTPIIRTSVSNRMPSAFHFCLHTPNQLLDIGRRAPPVLT